MFWIEIKLFQAIKISIYMVAKLNFSKGLVHEFGQEFEISSLLVLGKIVVEIVFGDVLDRNQAFPDYKMYEDVNFTWSPNWICLKGLVHDFYQECEMFFVVSPRAK